MRSLLILLILGPLSTIACESPLKFNAGPFFSTSMVIQFWQPFTKKVQEQTGCPVELIASPSFKHYLIDLLNNESDFYITPEHYGPALKGHNLSAILHSSLGAQPYLVSKFPVDPINPNDFKGSSIAVASKYSLVNLQLEYWAKTNDFKDTLTVHYNYSHDQAILGFIKGQHDSIIVIQDLFEKLPNYIKEKYYKTPFMERSGAYILVKNTLNKKIKSIAQASRSHLNFLTWSDQIQPMKNTRYSNRFKTQLQELEKEIRDTPKAPK